MNQGWSWATAIMLALGAGCLLVILMTLVVLAATFLSIAYTLSRPR